MQDSRVAAGISRNAFHAGAAGTRLLLVACLVAPGLSGCYEFQKAPDAPALSSVVEVAEAVLKERFYQTRVYRESGHIRAFGETHFEGVQQARVRVDVYIIAENTGHYMPRVSVQKYYDIAEPPLKSGDIAMEWGNRAGNAYPRPHLQPIYYDRALEAELYRAILERIAAEREKRAET